MACDAAPSGRQRPPGPGRPRPGLLPVRPGATAVRSGAAAVRSGGSPPIAVSITLAAGTTDGPVTAAGNPRAVGGTGTAISGAGAVPVTAARVVGLIRARPTTGTCSSVVLTARGAIATLAGASGARTCIPARPLSRGTVPLPVIASPSAGVRTTSLGPPATTIVSCLVPAGAPRTSAGPRRSWRPTLCRPDRPWPRARRTGSR